MKQIWMWPETDINSTTVSDEIFILTEVEEYFSSLYSPYKVVYFSRARVALKAISAMKNLSRPELTFVQPFSSHCVLSAISHQSTPTTRQPQESNQQVIYHQWGQRTKVEHKTYQNILVEDAVDSLILTNDKSEIFPNNAPFCVISLPKILPVSIGAIVVCQNEGDYKKLIKQRAVMDQEIDCIMECLNIPAIKEATLEAKPMLVPVMKESIKSLVEISAKKIHANLAAISRTFPQFTLPGGYSDKRLPSNLIFPQSEFTEQALYSLLPFSVSEKQRSYYDYKNQTCIKVWLIPCHAQAEWSE